MTAITITTAAPADPATVTEYGDALPELVRALNHVTSRHEALEYPPDADRLIRNLAAAASRLPQLLGQVSGWLEAEQAAGRIKMASVSQFRDAPGIAADVARQALEQAQAHARMLQQALDAAAAVTADMGGVEDGSGEGSGEN
jgi:hypothetical protein